MTPITAEFEKDRDTKRTVRFREVVPDGEEPVIGQLYVQKSALEAIGNPNKIRVAISPGQ